MVSHLNKMNLETLEYSQEIIEMTPEKNSGVNQHLLLTTPAKINLYLRVPERLENSYHIVQTIFAPIHELFDVVEIIFHDTDNETLTFTCNADVEEVPNDDNNLCIKAAKLFAEALNITPKWSINLHKNIPVAAGMGGGSSDAAAVLRMLNYHFGNKLTRMELKKIAIKIGADVPFFLRPQFATAEGIGDVLTSLNEIPEKTSENAINVLIVSPLFPVSAKWAYTHLAISTFSDNNTSECGNMYTKMQEALRLRNSLDVAKLLQNDLQYSVEEKFPLLTIIRQALYSVGANGVLMSGSGSTMFGIFCDNKFFNSAVGELENLLPKYCKITKATI